MTNYADTHSNKLGWLLDSHLTGLNGVQGALLISSDGLLSSRTSALGQEAAEKLAAVTASLRASALAYAAETGGGGLRQVVIETDARLYLVTRAGHNMLLGVETTSPDVDVALITEGMIRLADSVQHEMTVADRQTAAEEPKR